MAAPSSHSAAPPAPTGVAPELSFAVESAATVELAAAHETLHAELESPSGSPEGH